MFIATSPSPLTEGEDQPQSVVYLALFFRGNVAHQLAEATLKAIVDSLPRLTQ